MGGERGGEEQDALSSGSFFRCSFSCFFLFALKLVSVLYRKQDWRLFAALIPSSQESVKQADKDEIFFRVIRTSFVRGCVVSLSLSLSLLRLKKTKKTLPLSLLLLLLLRSLLL
jgi:hypothetical protein